MIEAKDTLGDTPLHLACENGHVDIISLLLNQNAELLKAKGQDGWTPLHTSCAHEQTDVTRVLLEDFSANANAQEERDGATPLHLATCNNKLEIVRLLLDHGDANAESKTNDDSTPLHESCRWNHLGLCRLLFDHNANVEAVDHKGWTPLYLTCKYRCFQVADELVPAQLPRRLMGGHHCHWHVKIPVGN
ncbi:unnamed protein product [Cylindrotheca closterium]|uniref:Uncharacterized protein n=1 Tax=Cylindrotheca closterium TaxID=2856 RepID=A0AAD2PV36_9STRA|nr:unnamed protein product [Cylindrotheca closterium]